MDDEYDNEYSGEQDYSDNEEDLNIDDDQDKQKEEETNGGFKILTYENVLENIGKK